MKRVKNVNFKMIRVRKELYDELVKTRASIELIEGKRLSLSDVIERLLHVLPKADIETKIPKKEYRRLKNLIPE